MATIFRKYVVITVSLLVTLTGLGHVNGWAAAYAGIWIALALNLLTPSGPVATLLATTFILTMGVVVFTLTLSHTPVPRNTLWESAALAVVAVWSERAYQKSRARSR